MATVKRNAKRRDSSTAPRTPLAFLKRAHRAVRSQLGATEILPTFVAATPGTLTAAQRRTLVDQALVLLEQNYVHLPLKRAMHAVDPVQKLRLIRRRLEEPNPLRNWPELEFHCQMQAIFASVRDLHTNYLLPAPFADKVAFLPFMVEDYFEAGERKYLVSHIVQGFTHPTFRKGVELRYWNGVPIDRAVQANGERYAGSNLDARHARGLETLAQRPLATMLPPDEEWVVVGYRTLAGADAELRVPWMVFSPEAEPGGGGMADALRRSTLGLDLELDLIHRARKPLFAPKVVEAEAAIRRAPARARAAGDLASQLPQVVEAKEVVTGRGKFGYLRIRTFMVDPEAFLAELVRMLALLPREGLILDLRENGGGNIYASERALQLFTPRRIEPEPMQFINTPLNLRLCKRQAETDVALGPWVESMEQALKTGSVMSAAIPLTPADLCNSHGQVYDGPVVLITDALCYSATDIFAAGFQDHAIGPILGTDGNTGAGGANVWSHDLLRDLFQWPSRDPKTPYEALPNGASMRVSIRRTLRVGARSGTPVEDLGVVPDQRHFMTRRDLLEDNVDLIEKAAALLAALPVRRLDVAIRKEGATVAVDVETRGIARVDLYVDDRPEGSLDVRDGRISLALAPRPVAPRTVRIEGFRDGERVAARRAAID